MTDDDLPVPADPPTEPEGPGELPPRSEQGAWAPPAWAQTADAQGGAAGERGLATFWWRVLGFLIDAFILAIPSSLILSPWKRNALVVVGVGIVVQVLYAGLLISLWGGQTVGMRLLRLRCVDAETWGPVAPGQAWVRSVSAQAMAALKYAAFILTLVEAADLLWPVFDSRNQTLHDKVAKTVVVREPRG